MKKSNEYLLVMAGICFACFLMYVPEYPNATRILSNLYVQWEDRLLTNKAISILLISTIIES